MNLRFQYNKTSLHALSKQLNIRVKALPILKNKEAALRLEVKKAKTSYSETENQLERMIRDQERDFRMWNEFDNTLLAIEEVKIKLKKIAGVKIPVLDELIFRTRDFNIFLEPKWFLEGSSRLKDILKLVIEKELALKKVQILEFFRKKTTQKVNLYEKVQIPEYENAIRKIKRFLEDEENLTKAAQKIVKSRQQGITEMAE
jgi:V/A-type H+/Na+-transporting ATPase subunit D